MYDHHTVSGRQHPVAIDDKHSMKSLTQKNHNSNNINVTRGRGKANIFKDFCEMVRYHMDAPKSRPSFLLLYK